MIDHPLVAVADEQLIKAPGVLVGDQEQYRILDAGKARGGAFDCVAPLRHPARQRLAVALHGGLDFVADAADDLRTHLPVGHAGQGGDNRQQEDGDEGQQTLFEGHRISGGTDRVFPDANSAVAGGSRRRSIRH